MLAIRKSEKATPKVVANVLPCKIQHSGPVNATRRHWTPEVQDGDKTSSTAHFRGRKLCGRVVTLPEGYKGAVLEKTNTALAPSVTATTDQDADADIPETKLLNQIAAFDELVVWGHEVRPDDAQDVYVKGVDEWMGLAAAMNSFDES